ncbi:MAG: ATP-binding protein, partial [Desulfobia sp.]
RQARMLHEQIRLTRAWIADHNGVFIVDGPEVEPNPFLDSPVISDKSGHKLIKHNPSMVIRSLSLYAVRRGLFRYGVTSLDPINPANTPDRFEVESLKQFQEGTREAIRIVDSDKEKTLRYIAPLKVKESCLECHSRQGYEIGDIRGGLSLSIPMGWAYQGIHENNRMLLAIAVATICLVSLFLFYLVDFLIVRRVQKLSRHIENYPEQPISTDLGKEVGANDEVGRLNYKFSELCRRLETSQEELEKTRQQVFQSEKLASLGRLMAGIGHEINNPLGGMLNCVKSMRQNTADQELQKRYLELVEKGLLRIKNTVRQLLNFGRQESLTLERVRVKDLIKECVELISYGLKSIKIQTDYRASEILPVNSEALKQVVMNICLNGIQAMPEGGILRLKTWEADSWLHIHISDSGEGIDKNDLPRIFDPFFTTKEVGEGTGLGLSVSYSLVEQMGGRIFVNSDKGQGTIFHIELPLRKE